MNRTSISGVDPIVSSWRSALRCYRDLLRPGLLITGQSTHQSRLQRLLNAKWKGRDCCLAYVQTH
jgi:hypothetical protein